MFRPRLWYFQKSSQVFFIHFAHNLALFLASCSCSFLLLVVANMICIFLVSRQLVLLSTLPNCLNYFCGQKECILLLFRKISPRSITRFWGAFAKLRKATISFVLSICRSVRPHGTTWLPFDRFSWNLTLITFSKLCRENSRSIKIGQEQRALYMKTDVHFWSCLPHFVLAHWGRGF